MPALPSCLIEPGTALPASQHQLNTGSDSSRGSTGLVYDLHWLPALIIGAVLPAGDAQHPVCVLQMGRKPGVSPAVVQATACDDHGDGPVALVVGRDRTAVGRLPYQLLRTLMLRARCARAAPLDHGLTITEPRDLQQGVANCRSQLGRRG